MMQYKKNDSFGAFYHILYLPLVAAAVNLKYTES